MKPESPLMNHDDDGFHRRKSCSFYPENLIRSRNKEKGREMISLLHSADLFANGLEGKEGRNEGSHFTFQS